MSHNITPLVNEYIETYKVAAPLLAKLEALKPQLRELGPGNYSVPDLGTLTITKPSEPKLKGTEYKLTASFATLPPKEIAKLQNLGAIRLENIYSKASASAVQVKLI